MPPTILRAKKLRFVIFPKDHDPPHIHVFGPEGEAKFDIRSLECIESAGFSQKTIWSIQAFVQLNQNKFMEAWNEWQEK